MDYDEQNPIISLVVKKVEREKARMRFSEKTER
jgi:hypothetical protein